jgi:hypothetical protein
MKKLFLILCTAIVALVSCTKDDESLDGRWNAPRFSEQPDDYAFSIIFEGNNLDLYIIAWGQHYKGTFTYSDGVINYTVTAAFQAYTDVSYDDQGNMTTWSWMAGDLDQYTLKLAEGYNWYDMRPDELEQNKEMFASIKFRMQSPGVAVSDLFGIEELTFTKEK